MAVSGCRSRGPHHRAASGISVAAAHDACMDAKPWTCKSVEPAVVAGRDREYRHEQIVMSNQTTKPRTRTRVKTERPRLHKVILLNDDYTPREFVVLVLKAEFRMSEEHAHQVMLTAHRKGACVVAVYARDVAETKATRATEAGRAKGYPLMFTTEPEE